jgi:hypothetical protein
MSIDPNIPEVVQQGFAFRATRDAGGLQCHLTGSADARATSELETFVKHMHAEARRLGVAEVVVDLNGCSFMNSSCFKAFLGWLAAIAELPGEARYKLRFSWDGSSYWQRRGLQALRSYAVNLVEV